MSETVDIVDREQIGGAGGTRGAVLAIGKLCSRPDGVLGSDEATRVQDLAISGAWRSTDRSLQ